jgi:hypothetical protein
MEWENQATQQQDKNVKHLEQVSLAKHTKSFAFFQCL